MKKYLVPGEKGKSMVTSLKDKIVPMEEKKPLCLVINNIQNREDCKPIKADSTITSHFQGADVCFSSKGLY